MSLENKIKVVGYMWVSHGGKNSCKDCRSLHGRKFYHHPESGQKSIENMPKRPVHPNCRCTVEPLTNVEVKLDPAEQNSRDPYIEGGCRFRGGIWGSNGRSMFNGPVWKKWCGEYWSGGRDVRDPNAAGPVDTSPADDMDRLCMAHDRCYDYDDEDRCDRKFVAALKALPDDPRRWRNPPREDEIEHARKYRGAAIWWFSGAIKRRENRLQGYSEDLTLVP